MTNIILCCTSVPLVSLGFMCKVMELLIIFNFPSFCTVMLVYPVRFIQLVYS